MPNSMIMNQIKSKQDCPVCGEPDTLVEHGHEEGDETKYLHFTECPECDSDGSIVIVAYDCALCGPTSLAMTNATQSYDGFGTTEVKRDGNVRTVVILNEHLKWQLERYWSGMNTGFCISRITGERIPENVA